VGRKCQRLGISAQFSAASFSNAHVVDFELSGCLFLRGLLPTWRVLIEAGVQFCQNSEASVVAGLIGKASTWLPHGCVIESVQSLFQPC
jgi:hypothetical protein